MQANELNELRAQIDVLDDQIVELLKKRFEITDAIGHIKIAQGLPIPHPERQAHRRHLLVNLAMAHGLEHQTLAAVYEGVNSQVVARHLAIAAGRAA